MIDCADDEDDGPGEDDQVPIAEEENDDDVSAGAFLAMSKDMEESLALTRKAEAGANVLAASI